MKKAFYFIGISILLIGISILHTVSINGAYCMHQEEASIEELTLQMSKAILQEPSMAMRLKSATAIPLSECKGLYKQLKNKSSDEGIKQDTASKLAKLFIQHADTEEKQCNIEKLLYPSKKKQPISEAVIPESNEATLDAGYVSEFDDGFLECCKEGCNHVWYDSKIGCWYYHSSTVQKYTRICDPQDYGQRSAIRKMAQTFITCSETDNILAGKGAEHGPFLQGDDIAFKTYRRQDKWSEKLWAVTLWLKEEIKRIGVESLAGGFRFLSAKVSINEGYEPTRMLNASLDKKGQLELKIVLDGSYLVDRGNAEVTNILEIIFSDKDALSACITNETDVSDMLANGKLQFHMASSPYSEGIQNQFIDKMKESLRKNQGTLSSGMTFSEPIHTKTYTFKDGKFY